MKLIPMLVLSLMTSCADPDVTSFSIVENKPDIGTPYVSNPILPHAGDDPLGCDVVAPTPSEYLAYPDEIFIGTIVSVEPLADCVSNSHSGLTIVLEEIDSLSGDLAPAQFSFDIGAETIVHWGSRPFYDGETLTWSTFRRLEVGMRLGVQLYDVGKFVFASKLPLFQIYDGTTQFQTENLHCVVVPDGLNGESERDFLSMTIGERPENAELFRTESLMTLVDAGCR